MSFSRTRSSPRRLLFAMQHLAYRRRSSRGDSRETGRRQAALRFLDRFFPSSGRRSRAALTLAHARAAELRGQLGHAASLFEQAGRSDEAARVILLQGDAAIDTSERLAHYLQAAHTAPEGSTALALARRKRASLLLAVA